MKPLLGLAVWDPSFQIVIKAFCNGITWSKHWPVVLRNPNNSRFSKTRLLACWSHTAQACPCCFQWSFLQQNCVCFWIPYLSEYTFTRLNFQQFSGKDNSRCQKHQRLSQNHQFFWNVSVLSMLWSLSIWQVSHDRLNPLETWKIKIRKTTDLFTPAAFSSSSKLLLHFDLQCNFKTDCVLVPLINCLWSLDFQG